MSLDPRIEIIRKEYGLRQDDFWKLPQGRDVWLVKHAALEVVAAKAGITFDMPEIIEANGGEGIAAICVRGFYGDRAIWSIGEANPKNCKNAYPWAIAEKRAIDRVVLKLVGLHGLVYSEEESDDFKPQTSAPAPANTQAAPEERKSSASLKRDGAWEKLMADFNSDLADCHSLVALGKLRELYRTRAKSEHWPNQWLFALSNEFELAEAALKKSETVMAG